MIICVLKKILHKKKKGRRNGPEKSICETQSVTSRFETSRYRDFSHFFESIGIGLEKSLSIGLEKI